MRSLIVLTLLCLTASSVGAQDREVDLVFAGDAIESSGLAPVIEELLDRVDVQMRQGPLEATLDPRTVLTPNRAAPSALARIWIEIGAERTTIYLVDTDWERILIRHVETSGTLDEVHREQVAHIVYAAVDALLAGARIGFTRAEAQAELGIEPERPPPVELDEPVEEPEPADGPSLGGDVFAGYGLGFFADGPTLRHAAMLLGSLLLGRGSPRAAISLGLDFWPTTSHEGAGLRLDLRSLTLRVEGGVDLDLAEGTHLRVSGGLGLDVTAVEPRSIPGSATMIGQAWDAVAPLLAIRLGLSQRLYDWIYLHAGVLLDIDLLDTHYVVQSGASDQTVLDPWLLRPNLYLAVGGHFL